MKIKFFPEGNDNPRGAHIYFENRVFGKECLPLFKESNLLRCKQFTLCSFLYEDGLMISLYFNPCFTTDECVAEIERLYATTTAQK